MKPKIFNIISVNLTLYHPRLVQRTYIPINLHADFIDCFTWNTKLLYVYIKANFVNDLFARNEIILWDAQLDHIKHAVITTTNPVVQPEDYEHQDNRARLPNKNMKMKYYLTDVTNTLSGRKVQLTMCYQIMFYSGYSSLHCIPESQTTVKMPEYLKSEVYSSII